MKKPELIHKQSKQGESQEYTGELQRDVLTTPALTLGVIIRRLGEGVN